MSNFRRFALLATIATYLLIFIGGLVRVSGAGLGCPDWPKCFGRWIPPTSVTQLPADIDPAEFNFVLAWIEYFNRLVGVAIGFLIFLTAVFAVKQYRKVPRILYPSLTAFVFVAYQGWQGGQVVTSELKPLFVSIHMVLALIIVSILIYVTQKAYYIERPDADWETTYPPNVNLWIGLLWIAGIVQVILGTQVRAGLEILREKLPFLPATEFGNHVGPVNYIHAVLGILIAALTWYAGLIILRKSRNLSSLIKDGLFGMMILALAQLVVGFVLVTAGLPSLMQLFHLWIGSLYIGVLFLLFSAFRRRMGGAHV